MPRGTNKKPHVSAAKWANRRKNRDVKVSSATKPLAKDNFIVDERATQKKTARREGVVPEWAQLRKGDHESIPGTRIQSLPGGVAVREILEDGKKFPPHKVLAAKRHLRKLKGLAEEKAEVERMINGTKAALPPSVEVARTEKPRASASSRDATMAPTESLGKKARKEAAWADRQQKLAAEHASRIAEDGRDLISQQWHEGTVLHRAQGRAWVKVLDATQIPERVLLRLREATAEIRSELSFTEGELLPVRYADVVDRSLDLRPGATLLFKVYTDKTGVGGCEAKPASEASSPGTKRAAVDLPEAGKNKKKRKAVVATSADMFGKAAEERLEAEAAAKTDQDRSAAEAYAKAEQERLEAAAATKAEQERLAAAATAKAEEERLEGEAKAKAEQERLAAEAVAKAEQERLATVARAKAEQERLAAEATAKAEQDRLAAEAKAKAEQERLAVEVREKAEQERLAVEARKAEQERLAAEAAKAEQDRLAAEATAKAAEQERVSAEARAKAEQERLAAEATAKAEQERLAAESRAKAEQERLAAEATAKAEQERLAAEATAKAEQERLAVEATAKAEQDRLAAEVRAKAEQERLAEEVREKAEQERLAVEARAKAEQERLAAEATKAEQDRLAAEAKAKAEQERLAAEATAKAECERLAAEARATIEQARLAAEATAKAEQERLAAEATAKAEQERLAGEAMAEQERLAAEATAKVEQERLAAETRAKAEEERLAAEATAKAEQERLAAEATAKAEQERLAAEATAKAEKESLAAETAAKAEQEKVDDTNWNDLKVEGLKELCRKAGLKVSGTKAELVARLKAVETTAEQTKPMEDELLKSRVDDLSPGEWFKMQFKEWQASLSSWKTRQVQWKNPVQKKVLLAKLADKKAANGDEALKEIDAEDIDVCSVEDVIDIGSGEPLFANFEFEDWALLSVRFELHLLVHAFRKDVNNPDRTGFHESHLPFYYDKYFQKQWSNETYALDTFKDVCKLVKENISLTNDGVVEALLSEDATEKDFVHLTEKHRRDRVRLVEVGMDSAALKFKRQP